MEVGCYENQEILWSLQNSQAFKMFQYSWKYKGSKSSTFKKNFRIKLIVKSVKKKKSKIPKFSKDFWPMNQ